MLLILEIINKCILINSYYNYKKKYNNIWILLLNLKQQLYKLVLFVAICIEIKLLTSYSMTMLCSQYITGKERYIKFDVVSRRKKEKKRIEKLNIRMVYKRYQADDTVTKFSCFTPASILFMQAALHSGRYSCRNSRRQLTTVWYYYILQNVVVNMSSTVWVCWVTIHILRDVTVKCNSVTLSHRLLFLYFILLRLVSIVFVPFSMIHVI